MQGVGWGGVDIKWGPPGSGLFLSCMKLPSSDNDEQWIWCAFLGCQAHDTCKKENSADRGRDTRIRRCSHLSKIMLVQATMKLMCLHLSPKTSTFFVFNGKGNAKKHFQAILSVLGYAAAN